MIPSYKFRGYNTHDPFAAERAYQEKFGVKPTLLVIRPGYHIEKFHPLLYESRFAASFAISATHEGTVADMKQIERQAKPARPTPPPLSNYTFVRPPAIEDNGNGLEDKDLPFPQRKEVVYQPAVIDINYIRNFHQNSGYVYMIASENGYQKIGRATNVETRRSSLEREIPLQMILLHCFRTDYYMAAETYMHDRYAMQRKKYEWFVLEPEQIQEFRAFEDYQFDEMLENRLLRDLR